MKVSVGKGAGTMVSIVVRSIFVVAVCLTTTTAGAVGTSASASPSNAAPAGKPARAADARASKTAAAKPKKPVVNRNGPVELFSVNGSETLLLRLRDDKGRPLRGVQKRFDHFLRCHHTNVQHPMNPRLVRLLYQVGKHYPGRRVEVVSGYRHPSVAKNPRSPHMQGLACDFRIAGVRNQELRDYLRRGYEKVGVGYYPNSSFVHLDVRKDRSAFWIDYSGPGERAMYADNPVVDLKTGRADTFKPLTIDKDWANDADQDGDTGRQPSSGRTSPLEEEEAGGAGRPEPERGTSPSGAARGAPGGETAAPVAAPSPGVVVAPPAPPTKGGAQAPVNVSPRGSVARQ